VSVESRECRYPVRLRCDHDDCGETFQKPHRGTWAVRSAARTAGWHVGEPTPSGRTWLDYCPTHKPNEKEPR
jgi:hypothetical protein